MQVNNFILMFIIIITVYPVNSLVTIIKELKYSITHPCPPQHKVKLNLLFVCYYAISITA